MATKNIEINYNNGTDYIALYPSTIISQVEELEGRIAKQIARGSFQGTDVVPAQYSVYLTLTIGFRPTFFILTGDLYKISIATKDIENVENRTVYGSGGSLFMAVGKENLSNPSVTYNSGYWLNDTNYYTASISITLDTTTQFTFLKSSYAGQFNASSIMSSIFGDSVCTYYWLAIQF